MIVDKVVYQAAVDVIHAYGGILRVLDLDPFCESGICYIDDNINILWLRQLCYDERCKMMSSKRIIIQRPPPKKEGWSDTAFQEDENGVDQRLVVFDYVESDAGEAGSYVFRPGQWMNHLQELHNTIEETVEGG